jgi:hypothetical protein
LTRLFAMGRTDLLVRSRRKRQGNQDLTLAEVAGLGEPARMGWRRATPSPFDQAVAG